MRALSRNIREELATVVQQIGLVMGRIDRVFTIRTALGDLTARRAASCLVAPSVGDRVLVVRGAAMNDASGEGAYVLAVLDRTSDEPLQIQTDGDTRWTVNDGGMAILADGPVELMTKSSMSLVAAKAKVFAGELLGTLETIKLTARNVSADAGAVKICADWIDSVATRVSARMRRSYRKVEEIEQVRVGQMDMVAEKNLTMRATNAVITGKTLAKVNAGQVHIG